MRFEGRGIKDIDMGLHEIGDRESRGQRTK